VAALPAPATRGPLVPTKATQQQELARLDARLAKFRADPAADPGLHRAHRAGARGPGGELEQPVAITGAVAVTVEQAKISCHAGGLDADAAAALPRYDDWVATRTRSASPGCRPRPRRRARRLRRRRAVRGVPRGGVRAVGEDAARHRRTRRWCAQQAVRPQLRRLPRDRVSRAGRLRGRRERGLQNGAVRAVPRPGSLHVATPEKKRQAERDPPRDGGRGVQAVPHAGALGHLRLRGVPARRAGSGARGRGGRRSARGRRGTSCAPRGWRRPAAAARRCEGTARPLK
jgi:hypothetical protein